MDKLDQENREEYNVGIYGKFIALVLSVIVLTLIVIAAKQRKKRNESRKSPCQASDIPKRGCPIYAYGRQY